MNGKKIFSIIVENKKLYVIYMCNTSFSLFSPSIGQSYISKAIAVTDSTRVHFKSTVLFLSNCLFLFEF